MMDNLDRLTEFAPPKSDTPKPRSFFNRFLPSRQNTTLHLPSTSSSSASSVAESPLDESSKSSDNSGGNSSSYTNTPDEPLPNQESAISTRRRGSNLELRTLGNVLGRIVAIIEKKANFQEGLKSYKDSDFRQSWMPDSSSRECYDCGSKFTTFLRRHHCRICGMIFCSRCCNQEVPGRLIGFEGGLRACTYCSRVVSSCILQLQSTDDLGSLKDNLNEQIRNDSQLSLDSNPTPRSHTPNRRLSQSDESFEAGLSTVPFDMPPLVEPMEGMTSEERQTLLEDSADLRSLFFEMYMPTGVPRSNKRYRIRNYQECFYGSELTNWLMDRDQAKENSQATVIGQALLEAKYIICLNGSPSAPFHDGETIYKLRDLNSREVTEIVFRQNLLQEDTETIEGPEWIQDLDENAYGISFDTSSHASPSVGGSSLTINQSVGTSGMYAGLKQQDNVSTSSHDIENMSSSSSTIGRSRHPSSDTITVQNDLTPGVVLVLANSHLSPSSDHVHLDPQACDAVINDANTTLDMSQVEFEGVQDHNSQIVKAIKQRYDGHVRQICIQQLKRNKLPLTWEPLLVKLAQDIHHFVRPDGRFLSTEAKAKCTDITDFLHIKKLRSGEPKDSEIIWGVVATKSVIHRRMRQTIKSPQIMLLKSSLEYQRVDNKLTSIESQIMQEHSFMRNCVERIVRYKPDILLVENTVSRVAQDLLFEAGITVAINVKSTMMQRVARLTMADIIPSIDNLISRPQLGTCYKFYTKTYRFTDGHFKTLMVFNGCPANLGCTVLLRDPSYKQLIKVKEILKLLVFTSHHCRLEMSYLLDQSATIPLSDDPDTIPDPAASTENSDVIEEEKEQAKHVERTSAALLGWNASIDDDASAGISTTEPETDNFSSDGENTSFQSTLSKTILDISPFVAINAPYFETSAGKANKLRQFFKKDQYWSPLLTGENETEKQVPVQNEGFDYRLDEDHMQSQVINLAKPHPFITRCIDCSANDRKLKDEASLFRATGGRLMLKNGRFTSHDFSVTLEKTEGETASDAGGNQPDCFRIYEHQQISVLFSSYPGTSRYLPCIKPWLVNMEFYGKNDLHLGHFLEQYCFRDEYVCNNLALCETPMLNHIRRFVYEGMCLHLIAVKQQVPQDLSTAEIPDNQTIFTWSWCNLCKKATPITRLTPMAWNLSLAKFLQLRLTCTLFGSQAIPGCQHLISRDYCQYFKLGDKVTAFKCTAIKIRQVEFPSSKLSVQPRITLSEIRLKVKRVHHLGLGLYANVMKSFHHLETNGVDSEGKKQILSNHKEELEMEKSWFTTQTDTIQCKIIENFEQEPMAPLSITDVEKLYELSDDLTTLQIHLSRSTVEWNKRISRLSNKEDKNNEKKGKDVKRSGAKYNETSSMPNLRLYTSVSALSVSVEEQELMDSPSYLTHGRVLDYFSAERASLEDPASSADPEGAVASLPAFNKYDPTTIDSLTDTDSFAGASPPKFTLEPLLHEDSTVNLAVVKGESASLTAPATLDAVQIRVKPGTETEDDTTPRNSTGDASSVNSALIEHMDSNRSSSMTNVASSPASTTASTHLPEEEKVKKDVKKGTSRLLLEAAKGFRAALQSDEIITIENPFSDNEHYMLFPTIKIPVVVYDEEPSSIIAYTLGSRDYEDSLIELSKQAMLNRSQTEGAISAFSESDLKHISRSRQEIEDILKRSSVSSITAALKLNPATVIFDGAEPSSSSPNQAKAAGDDVDSLKFGTHQRIQGRTLCHDIELEFTEPMGSDLKEKRALFYCKVVYATEFKKLRRLIFPQGEDQFIRSLSRCYKWNAQGGKSRLGFCKSQDDRFVIKQMSAKEIQSFMEFAPHYFQYLTETVKSQGEQKKKDGDPHVGQPRTTALAKIFGVYRVGMKNCVTGTEMRQDVLVMENLFYGRNIKKVFDLKGSERNRMVKKEEVSDAVLLDENFMKMMRNHPVYVHQYTKTILIETLLRDSQFLASLKIMDYSLLCGFDEESKCLVVGIIDYIRTFTWDKKLETIFKSSGIIGGQGKMPTIVSPEVYRNRFTDAMFGYFHAVPDRWTDFAADHC